MNEYDLISSRLSRHPIFSVLPREELAAIASDPRCETKSYRENDLVFSEHDHTTALGLILSGSVLVHRVGGGNPVLLNRIPEGRLFGAAALFAEAEPFVTRITAAEPTAVFFLPAPLCEDLIRRRPDFAVGYVRFLSDRIRFLNRRIAELSAPGTEQKLAQYLSERDEVADLSMVQLAASLGIGRASLYRALDSLTERGLIERAGRGIRSLDREGLRSFVLSPDTIFPKGS